MTPPKKNEEIFVKSTSKPSEKASKSVDSTPGIFSTMEVFTCWIRPDMLLDTFVVWHERLTIRIRLCLWVEMQRIMEENFVRLNIYLCRENYR